MTGERVMDACGERRLAGVVQSNRQTTVGQNVDKFDDCSDSTMSEHTVHDEYSACLNRSGLFWCDFRFG